MMQLRDKQRWVFEVMGDAKLSLAQRLIGVAIAEHVYLKTGRCDPSYGRLAKLTGLNRGTVINAVTALVRRGHLAKRLNRKTGKNDFTLRERDLLTDLEAPGADGGSRPRTTGGSRASATGGVVPARRGESSQHDSNRVLNSALNSVVAAPPADAWEELERKLRSAAGLENSPAPDLLVVGPIAGLLEAGYSLELDVLPVLRSKRGRNGARAPGSWKYFLPAIEQAHAERVGIASRPAPGRATAPPAEEQWRDRMTVWCRSRAWHPLWGPTPDEPDCKIPQRLRDDWAREAAA